VTIAVAAAAAAAWARQQQHFPAFDLVGLANINKYNVMACLRADLVESIHSGLFGWFDGIWRAGTGWMGIGEGGQPSIRKIIITF
jgi:hypothetical protein